MELLPADTAPFTYEEAGEADALTVDADGLLYAMVWVVLMVETLPVQQQSRLFLNVYHRHIARECLFHLSKICLCLQ